jgi:hypothetical protein
MRSKWLDWQPGNEIMQTSREATPSKPTKRAFDGFVGSQSRAVSITCDSRADQTTVRVRGASQSSVPVGAILLAPRYDGGTKPLASLPKCWCCEAPWKLEQIEESKGKTFALLEPSCGCLDARACYRCFVCRSHCRCTQDATLRPPVSQ